MGSLQQGMINTLPSFGNNEVPNRATSCGCYDVRFRHTKEERVCLQSCRTIRQTL
jgi:hypothetical protein